MDGERSSPLLYRNCVEHLLVGEGADTRRRLHSGSGGAARCSPARGASVQSSAASSTQPLHRPLALLRCTTPPSKPLNPFPIPFRRPLCSQPPTPPPASPSPAVVSSDLASVGVNGVCPGCGITMQSSDPALPGFFLLPSIKSPDYRARLAPVTADDTSISASLKSGKLREDLDASPPAAAEEDKAEGKVLVCARCHSLRHYGLVKRPDAERLLPDFDFVSGRGPAPSIAVGGQVGRAASRGRL